jgi:hypothetical protein
VSEATPEDVLEQRASPTGDGPVTTAAAVPAEADPADVAEQSVPVGPGEHVADRALPLEADAADAAEQAVVVELDEDEGR